MPEGIDSQPVAGGTGVAGEVMGENPERRAVWPWAIGIPALAAAYFAAARFGLSLAFEAEQVSLVWPPTGLALAAVLLFGYRVWPGIAVGAFLANALANEPLATAGGIAIGNTLEAVAGAWLLRRWAGFDIALARLRDVLALILLAAGLSTTISATIGVTSLCLGGVNLPAVQRTIEWSDFGWLWWDWWLGDAMGAVVVAPVFLVWAPFVVPRLTQGKPRDPWPAQRLVEAGALATGLVVAGLAVFGEPLAGAVNDYSLKYVVFPFVIWAALRFGQPGAATVTLVASSLAIWGTVRGLGPFGAGSIHDRLLSLQLFMGVVALTGLLLGAALTERAGADAEVRASESRLRLALEAGRMGTWEWNLRTNEVIWSPGLEAIHGLAPGTFAGSFDAYLNDIHPDDRELVIRSITQTVQQGSEHHIEYRIVWPDRSEHWVEGKGKLFHDATGKPVRLSGVCADITARKRLEEELRERVEQLAEADRRKDEFLALLAHELRNPLAPMRNGIEVMKEVGLNNPRLERTRATLERQVQQMSRMVDDLLDVSRITRGKIALQKEPTDLATVVTRAVETSRPLIDARRHELEVSLPAEPVCLDADPIRLAQIVANLLNNAAKYTEPGGKICVAAAVHADDDRVTRWHGDQVTREPIAVAEKSKSGGHPVTPSPCHHVIITVRDTGVGIAPEMLPRVFEPFVQGSQALDRSDGGLGIGLTLVRSLVEMHGGQVSAVSDGPGKGSAFVIRLPVLHVPALTV